MFPSVNPTETAAWKALQAAYDQKKDQPISDLFKNDEKRFEHFSVQSENILFDYSKNNIDHDTLALLLKLADQCQCSEAIEAMFTGEKINQTEDRAVLHTALRNFSGTPVLSDGKDLMPEVHAVQQQMKTFCTDFVEIPRHHIRIDWADQPVLVDGHVKWTSLARCYRTVHPTRSSLTP